MNEHRPDFAFCVSRYQKRPVVIEAIRFSEDGENREDIINWIGGPCRHTMTDEDGCIQETANLFIRTLEGEMMARPGDWVIKGVQGEFYPCKHDIFEASYELVLTPSQIVRLL